MRTEIITVTPELAKTWMYQNHDNRQIKNGVVQRYADMMLRGEWELTHQGIAFDSAGALRDGQHRLLAVVASNRAVDMMVSWGVDSARMMDRGAVRTAADILRKPQRHAEMAAFLFRLAYDLAAKPSPNQIAAILEALAPYFEQLDQHVTGTTTPIASSCAARTAAMYAVMTGESPGFVFGLYRKLVLNLADDLPRLAQNFVKQRLGNRFFEGFTMNEGSGSSGNNRQAFIFFKMLPLFRERNQQLTRWPKLTEDQIVAIRADIKNRLAVDCATVSRFQVQKLVRACSPASARPAA